VKIFVYFWYLYIWRGCYCVQK